MSKYMIFITLNIDSKKENTLKSIISKLDKICPEVCFSVGDITEDGKTKSGIIIKI